MGWKAHVEGDPSRRTTDVYLTHLGNDAETYVMPVDITMKTTEPGGRIEPMLSFGGFGVPGEDMLQAIVDAAAEKGIVARIDEAPANKIEAVERHLHDMRAIVGKQLDVDWE
jgi:hypothetical protein